MLPRWPCNRASSSNPVTRKCNSEIDADICTEVGGGSPFCCNLSSLFAAFLLKMLRSVLLGSLSYDFTSSFVVGFFFFASFSFHFLLSLCDFAFQNFNVQLSWHKCYISSIMLLLFCSSYYWTQCNFALPFVIFNFFSALQTVSFLIFFLNTVQFIFQSMCQFIATLDLMPWSVLLPTE